MKRNRILGGTRRVLHAGVYYYTSVVSVVIAVLVHVYKTYKSEHS